MNSRTSQRLCHAPRCLPSQRKRRTFALVAGLLLCSVAASSRMQAQDLDLSPTRPTISNSATIQDRGVLQVESGYDAYPQHVPGDQQTLGISLFYAPLKRLRLDFGWSPFSLQEGDGATVSGVGTIQLGGKFVVYKEDYHRALPGIAVQYEAELPTASNQALQGYGQQIILLVNHHYGKDGILDVIVNGSLVQSECETANGCSYGGQQSFALSYHLQKQTRLYAEVFGQNNSQSNTPPGTYFFGGFYRQFTDAFGLDGGMRFGLTDHSSSVGATVGVVFGRRLSGGSPSHAGKP